MLSWLENAYSCRLFRRAILMRKVGRQSDVGFDAWRGFIIVGLCTQYYKSLCVQKEQKITARCDTRIDIIILKDDLITLFNCVFTYMEYSDQRFHAYRLDAVCFDQMHIKRALPNVNALTNGMATRRPKFNFGFTWVLGLGLCLKDLAS